MKLISIVRWIQEIFSRPKLETESQKECAKEQDKEIVCEEIKLTEEPSIKENATYETNIFHEKRIQGIGTKGERISNFNTLPITAYGKQLRNIYIPMPNGETTEIDTVIISISGIYVIETKNYSGQIYGKQEDKNWTVCYPNSKKFIFYNPIKQNETHIWALQNQLHNIENDYFFSIVAFSDSCIFKKILFDESKTTITHQKELRETFKKLLHDNVGLIPKDTVNTIFERLKLFTIVSDEVKQNHIDNINRRIRQKVTTEQVFNLPVQQ